MQKTSIIIIIIIIITKCNMLQFWPVRIPTSFPMQTQNTDVKYVFALVHYHNSNHYNCLTFKYGTGIYDVRPALQ